MRYCYLIKIIDVSQWIGKQFWARQVCGSSVCKRGLCLQEAAEATPRDLQPPCSALKALRQRERQAVAKNQPLTLRSAIWDFAVGMKFLQRVHSLACFCWDAWRSCVFDGHLLHNLFQVSWCPKTLLFKNLFIYLYMMLELGKMLLEKIEICQGKMRHSVGLDFFTSWSFSSLI